ncbi:MAG: peptide ABC transporter substrate-binding protein [Oscillospiraceae bacterium]
MALAAACAVMLTTTACRNKDGSGYVFKYDISYNPVTLDPQLANDKNSELIIGNVFMGLLTLQPDGSLAEGVASDYIVSDDGLKYTFKLRQDVYWTDGGDFEQQCTAHDFVYGFQRLFLPETNAPRAKEYYCIKNARPVNMGAVGDASVIGVKANGDFELEITLDYPNIRFLTLLTEPPAMPCSEEYFLLSQGKYGLSAECTPSNGAFYLKSWNYSPYNITDVNNLILRRNAKNSAARQIYPSGLNFFIEDEADFVGDFLSGTTSCIAVSDDDAALITGEYTCTAFSNITVGLVFNRKKEVFGSEDLIQALARLTDRETVAAALEHYAPAQAIVPHEVSMLDKSYRELVGSEMTPEYSVSTAKSYFEKAKDTLDRSLFTGARVIVPDDAAAEAVSYIMQEWQREFGFYCVVERLNEKEYSARLESGDYEIAAVELTGSYNSPAAYMDCFRKSVRLGGFSDMEFESLMNRAEECESMDESAELYRQAEQLLINKAAFVPLYFKNEYFFIGEDMTDIYYNSFTKTVDFSQAKQF